MLPDRQRVGGQLCGRRRWRGRWLPSTSGCSGTATSDAIDALVLLAAFRPSATLEWLPWMAAFLVAAVADGAISRVIGVEGVPSPRSEAQRFALYASTSILSGLRRRRCAWCCRSVLLHPLWSAPASWQRLALSSWGRSESLHRYGPSIIDGLIVFSTLQRGWLSLQPHQVHRRRSSLPPAIFADCLAGMRPSHLRGFAAYQLYASFNLSSSCAKA